MTGAAYQKARRDSARAAGRCALCCRRPAAAGIVRCQECADRSKALNRADYVTRRLGGAHTTRTARASGVYVPLEELLSSPRIRFLRRLRHFDWSTSDAVLEAMDVTASDERNRFTAALRVAIRRGEIDRRRDAWTYEYRITASGRDALKQLATDYDQRLGEAAA